MSSNFDTSLPPDGFNAQLNFAPSDHGVEETDARVAREFGDMNRGGTDRTTYEKGSAVSAFEKRVGGGAPVFSVEEGDVGDGGIGEIAVAEDEDIIGCAALGESGIERRAISVFARIVEVRDFDALEGMDRAELVGVEADVVSP